MVGSVHPSGTSAIPVARVTTDASHNANSIKTATLLINNNPTTILVEPFSDRIFVLVTQSAKLGTIVRRFPIPTSIPQLTIRSSLLRKRPSSPARKPLTLKSSWAAAKSQPSSYAPVASWRAYSQTAAPSRCCSPPTSRNTPSPPSSELSTLCATSESGNRIERETSLY